MGPDGEGTPTPFKSALMQVLMCIISNTALLSSGMTLGFTAVSLPYMEHPNELLYIDKNQSSWIASCAALAIPVGCLLSGPLMDRMGRRSALLLSCLPAFVGWLWMAVRPGFWSVVAGRLFTGLGTGISSTPATVFVAEAADSSIRGFLLAGTSIAISLGITLVYLMGLILKSDWRSVCVVCGIFPVLGFLSILLWLPESPQWLAGKGRSTEATRALARIRGESPTSESIVQEVREMARRPPAPGLADPAAFKAFALPETYKPFVIMNIFFLFQQLTGIFVVIFYAVDVVKEAGVTMDPFVVTVLIGLTRLLFTVIGGLMSRKWGRRPCSLISGAGMSASLLLLAGHLYLQSTPSEAPLLLDPTDDLNATNTSSISPITPPNASIIPVVSILVYILTSTVGFLTLPWSMLGEVFPSQVRGLASGLTTCITYLVSSITVKLYPTMLSVLDKHGVFFFYGAMAVLGTVFVAIFLPETQGKSLAQVEQYFAGKSRRKPTEEEENLNMTKMVTIVPSKNKTPVEV